MDSQSSDISEIIKFDENFLKLLEVDGGCVKGLKYHKCVKEAKNFYRAYVKKCNEYNTYIDFFTPLCWHLVACGIGYDKALKYLLEIKDRLLLYLKGTMESGTFNRIVGEMENIGQNH